MSIRLLTFAVLIAFHPFRSVAHSGDTAAPLLAAKSWWQAVTFGDTAYVREHATDSVTLIFNNGRNFTKAGIIAQVATHDPSANITLDWTESVVQTPASQTAIVTARVVERVGKMDHTFRFITVLVRKHSAWVVAAAQSTRELELATPITPGPGTALAAYAGNYRTPAGLLLKIVVRENDVTLVEPSGTETALQMIAPDLFEIPRILSAGNVRFAFIRDGKGSIANLIRIAHKITTMPRVR